jgi:hypothetical protein
MLCGHHQGEEVRVRADAEAYVALYDSQAVRLHSYCWSLVGDQAASAVRDVFTAAAHPYLTGRDARRREAAATPGRLWLYRQARAECLRRGPVTVMAGRDPLLRGAARLRADQREVLVLAADLPPAGLARVLGVTPDRAIHLVTAARARLEQAVLKVLLADPATATHEDVIAAFERGALGALLARRAPAPPPGLRAAVIGTMTRHQHTPLVVISPPAKAAQDGAEPKGRQTGRHARVTPMIGAAAACAAAVVGAIAAGTTLNFNASPAGGDGHGALAPSTAEHARSGQAAAPGSGESPIDEVSPTGSADPRPIGHTRGDAQSPSASTSAADPSTSDGAASAGSPSQVPDSPDPSAGSPVAPAPSSPSAPSGSTPPGSKPPGTPPSSSPPDGLLPGLPLIPNILGNAVSSVTGG